MKSYFISYKMILNLPNNANVVVECIAELSAQAANESTDGTNYGDVMEAVAYVSPFKVGG